MFPIYGMACIFSPLSQKLKTKNTLLRGSIYTAFIFAGEFLSGLFLKKHRICPWDYSRAKFNIKGVIRLDYAPLWFTAGLFFEKFLKNFISFRFKCHALSNETNGIVNITPIVEAIP